MSTKNKINELALGLKRRVARSQGVELLAFLAMVFLAVSGVIMLVSVIWFIVGWAVVSIIGLFTTVAITGYWAHALIGLAVIIVVKVIS